MSRVRAYVVGVSAPVVAHSESQWAVTVIYLVKQGSYQRKVRRVVFTSFRPQLHTWINCGLI